MVTVAIWTIGGLLTVQVLLLMFMMIKKHRELNLVERLNALDETLTAEFEDFIQGKKALHPRFPEKTVLKVHLMEAILERSLEDADDLQTARIRELAEESLTKEYRKRLKHGGWANRINALYFIEDFKMNNLVDEVYSTVDKSRSRGDEEFRQGLRTMAALQDRRLFEFLEKSHFLPASLVKQLFQLLNERAVHVWFSQYDRYEDVPEHLLGPFISHCGDVKAPSYQAMIEACLSDPRDEIRIKAVKAMSWYGEVLNESKIEPFFTSALWQERVMVTKLIGSAGLNAYQYQLKTLMSDPEWWVRYAAANALRQLDGGEEMLRKIAVSGNDPFAKDMAGYTLTTKWGLTS